MTSTESEKADPAKILIIGGGMGGLVLALALKKHLATTSIEIYEQSRSFTENTGGAIGMYPNGLRVIRDISPEVLKKLRDAGFPYIYRRWMRHDGTEVACAREDYLTGEEELSSFGIRRWKLQTVLYDAVIEAGISIAFQKRVVEVVRMNDKVTKCCFEDGTFRETNVLVGADGVKSKVRDYVVGATTADPEYTGVTCIMGTANLPRPVRGICFPSSSTTKCHACYYPTGDSETVFQIYFHCPENPESWGLITPEESKIECEALADKLKKDGWDEALIEPLHQAENVVRVGLRSRDPLDKWTEGNVVLLGDAAHPAVPYIGQGAMMAIEDAGVLALMLKHYCQEDDASSFDFTNLNKAFDSYQKVRIDRTRQIIGASKALGETQQKRAESSLYNFVREVSIKLQVLTFGTLRTMYPGATYNYTDAMKDVYT